MDGMMSGGSTWGIRLLLVLLAILLLLGIATQLKGGRR